MTPLTDQQHKLDILEHLNDDHAEELLTITRAYGQADATQAHLIDIFEEGCLIDTGAAEPLTIRFTLKGDLEEKILYLAYDAMVRQGNPLDGNKKQYFTVVRQEAITTNIMRLYLQSAQTLPQEAGYALCFSLKTLSQLPPTPARAAKTRASLPVQWMNRLLLIVLKHLSPKRRQKIFENMNKDKRYYTVRGQNAQGHSMIDIYRHSASPGRQWLDNLQAGDIIHSLYDYHERTEHLHQGQTLLLCDETSCSTVIALLENWQNPVPPHIIFITHHPADQAYFTDAHLPAGSTLHRLYYLDSTTQDLIALINTLPPLDSAWGALEHDAAKAARHHIRTRDHLDGQRNRIKAYWRKTREGRAEN